jgi:hypothetical protein
MQASVAAIILSGLAAATASVTSPTWLGRFSSPGPPPPPWHMVTLPGHQPTRYRVAVVGGKVAMEAIVDRSMSLMARPVSIDLAKTPILCWRWYVDGSVAKADMTRRSGDDYAARLYIAFDLPDTALSRSARFRLSLARTMFGRQVPDAALVYVWDNRHAIGTARRSSYTDRSQLVVTESGDGRAHKWVAERADLASDFARAFGSQAGTPIQVAVAADGDNTNSIGRAAFADIHFVPRGQPCAA